jgi:hypothetical protein
MEIPIYFSNNDFEMSGIEFSDGFDPKWNRNAEKGSLVFLDYSKNQEPLTIPRGKIIEFKLKAQQDVADFSESLVWHPDRNVEIVGKGEIILIPDVFMEVLEILPPDLYAEIRSGVSVSEIMIESPVYQSVQLRIINYQGYLMVDQKLEVSPGQNINPLPSSFVPGFYMCVVKGEEETRVVKWINN